MQLKSEVSCEAGTSFKVLKRAIVLGLAFMLLLIRVGKITWFYFNYYYYLKFSSTIAITNMRVQVIVIQLQLQLKGS